MRLEPVPRLQQALHVSPRLITASTILHLSSDELERTISQEQIENLALEVIEHKVCLYCGTRLYGQTCFSCGYRIGPSLSELTPYLNAKTEAVSLYDAEVNWYSHQHSSFDTDNHGFIEADGEDAYDPLARIPMRESLAEMLLRQLEALLPPDEAPLAEQLVGNLNERGYLAIEIHEIAEQADAPIERVAHALHQLQSLEPSGIGARDLRECLLIQLNALSEQETPHPLARTLIEHYLDRLGRNQFVDIAKALEQPEQEIRAAVQYIRSKLHPFPAFIFRDEASSSYSANGAPYIRPDVIIRNGSEGFEIELIEEKRYHFGVRTQYFDYVQAPSGAPVASEVEHYLHGHKDHAAFFVACIQRRWQTLRRVVTVIVSRQQAFLEKGIRYLQPLTRAEVAAYLDLDEGTVSRAIAHKYALLPNGRLLPLADFFDGSLAIKDMLRELIRAEHPRHRLSDDELTRLLAAQGVALARRTVTKYREEMGIGSSRER